MRLLARLPWWNRSLPQRWRAAPLAALKARFGAGRPLVRSRERGPEFARIPARVSGCCVVLRLPVRRGALGKAVQLAVCWGAGLGSDLAALAVASSAGDRHLHPRGDSCCKVGTGLRRHRCIRPPDRSSLRPSIAPLGAPDPLHSRWRERLVAERGGRSGRPRAARPLRPGRCGFRSRRGCRTGFAAGRRSRRRSARTAGWPGWC